MTSRGTAFSPRYDRHRRVYGVFCVLSMAVGLVLIVTDLAHAYSLATTA